MVFMDIYFQIKEISFADGHFQNSEGDTQMYDEMITKTYNLLTSVGLLHLADHKIKAVLITRNEQ